MELNQHIPTLFMEYYLLFKIMLYYVNSNLLKKYCDWYKIINFLFGIGQC